MRTRFFAIAFALVIVFGLLSPSLAVSAAAKAPGWLSSELAGSSTQNNNWQIEASSMALYGPDLFLGCTSKDQGCEVWRCDGSYTYLVELNGFGDTNNRGVVSLAVYNGMLYAGTQNEATGCEIWRYDGFPSTWSQVNADGFGSAANRGAVSMAVFNNCLYAATQNDSGCQVWRYDGSAWVQVNASGFGDANNKCAESMVVFNGQLCAGTRNASGCQVWRYNGSTWTPLQTAGFGDVNNTSVTSSAVLDSSLYFGTENTTSGCELWRYDGGSWVQANGDGFGDSRNTAASALAVFQGYLHVSTANSHGCRVWRYQSGIWYDWTLNIGGGFGDGDNIDAGSLASFRNELYAGTRNTVDLCGVYHYYQNAILLWFWEKAPSTVSLIRYYRSSIDGAVLPCATYLPPPTGQPQRLRMDIDLHAFGAVTGVPVDNSFRDNQVAVMAPWGRNLRNMYSDGLDDPARREPRIVDDFDASSAGWTPQPGGLWGVSGGWYEQSNTDGSLKESLRGDSAGMTYTASVDIKEVSRTGNSDAGLELRRQTNGDAYLVTLSYHDGAEYASVKRRTGGSTVVIAEAQLGDYQPGVIHNLKAGLFQDCIEVQVDNKVINLPNADFTISPYAEDASFSAGGVALCSSGGRHRFDNFRVQNEFLYGERDAMDCLQQFLEQFSNDPNYRIDPSKIYLTGFSMGSLGAWNLGLQYPDIFAGIHPTNGPTDLSEAYNWIRSQYPDNNTDPAYKHDQDGHILETADCFKAGLGDSSPSVATFFKQHSARYLLENALNTPVRIEHPEYDSIVPDTTAPMAISWFSPVHSVTFFPFSINWTLVGNRQSPVYANSKYIWNKWKTNTSLANCSQETSGYDWNTGAPPGGSPPDYWDNLDYTDNATYGYFMYGAHFNVLVRPNRDQWYDIGHPDRIVRYFLRMEANQAYRNYHQHPDEVAYRTYDDAHNGAWWLKTLISAPGTGQPGLARVKKSGANGVVAHVKNVATTTVDVKRLGLSTASGQTLTVSVDNATGPYESEPVPDTYNKTTIKLVGDWNPQVAYTVRDNGNPASYTVSGTALTVPDVQTNATHTITVIAPQGLTNLLADPDFEQGDAASVPGWTSGNHTGGGEGVFEHSGTATGDEGVFAHTLARSVRIKDAKAGADPYLSSWDSSAVSVIPGRSYTASAFVKTRELFSKTRVFENGKYSENPASNAYAKVGIVWLNGSQAPIGAPVLSDGLLGNNDWTPLEKTAVAPTGAAYAKVTLCADSPDGQGSNGSAWFDDAALTTVPGQNPAPTVTSIAPSSGNTNTVVNITDLIGTGFQSGASVRLEYGGVTIDATNVAVVSPARITCTLSLGGTAGSYDVVVRNPDGQEGRKVGAFTITAPCGSGAGGTISLFGLMMGLLSVAGSGKLFGRLHKPKK
jgi:hypothetical protein